MTYQYRNNKTTRKRCPSRAVGSIYVQNGSCPGSTWPECSSGNTRRSSRIIRAGSDCGKSVVKGKYSGELTIAAENDIIIEGNIEKTSSTGLLGLIANNFVRIKHPFCRSKSHNDHTPEEGCPFGKSRPRENRTCGTGMFTPNAPAVTTPAARLPVRRSKRRSWRSTTPSSSTTTTAAALWAPCM